MSQQPSDDIVRKDWIVEKLTALPFVEWDRFTLRDFSDHEDTPDGEQRVSVYGWIDRDGDEYKDFVLVTLWPLMERVGHTTSSESYSEEIHARLHGEDVDEVSHAPCRRVEDTFDVNAVKLAEEVPET